MVKKVLFTVRRRYFNAIVADIKNEEIRSFTPRWKWLLGLDPPEVAVFLCGRDVHRRHITKIYLEDPEKVLGRPLSEQGRKDISTPTTIIIELGEKYKEEAEG